MKKTIQFIAMAALCFFLGSLPSPLQAQIKALKIGDTVPDEVWKLPLNVLNHPDGKTLITLNDYKGKVIILDFWATWCAACIASFPKARKIQDSLPGKVSFIAATYESAEKASSFFENKRSKGITYDFPSVVGDTFLKSLFPHTGIPHYVWIDPGGKVSAITTAERITTENIRLVMQNAKPVIPVKNDQDARRPLFLSDALEMDDLSAYSVLTKGNFDGLASGTRFRRSGDIIRGQALTNSTILWMYEAAVRPLFSDMGDEYTSKRIVLEVTDSAKLVPAKAADGSYLSSNIYNYELIVPLSQADSLYRYMLEDLNRYTAYAGRIEKRNVRCLVLVRSDKTDRIKTTGGKKENSLFFKKPARLTNGPMSYLITRLNALKDIKVPVTDESGYTGKVDLEFSGSTDLETLKKELNAYGLDLKEEYRSLNMFILADKASKKILTH